MKLLVKPSISETQMSYYLSSYIRDATLSVG